MKSMSQLNFKRTVFLSAAAVLLAGCDGGEPTEADLNSNVPKGMHVVKQDCAPAAGKPGFVCDVTLQQKQDGEWVNIKDTQYRYIQTAGGDWKNVR